MANQTKPNPTTYWYLLDAIHEWLERKGIVQYQDSTGSDEIHSTVLQGKKEAWDGSLVAQSH